MRQIVATDHLSVARDMYQQERRVAVSLAKHVAALLTNINNVPTDWNVVYEAAHVREAKNTGADASRC